MNTPNYWGFRINSKDGEALKYLVSEIHEGRLRQGWGWDIKQDLRNLQLDEGARANIPIFNNVKQGDYLLIPHCPSYAFVSIVRAAQDFSTGYSFKIDKKDYGHIFPIEKDFHLEFARNSKVVDADLRSTLRTPMRFWNMNNYGDSILKIIDSSLDDRKTPSQNEQRTIEMLEEAIVFSLNENMLRQKLGELFEKCFQASEWEFALRKSLELLLPHCYVKRVGGKQEAKHGCDLAVFIPSIEKDRQYVIGIQIKDYKGIVGSDVINQIKREGYWTEDSGYTLIDKYLIIIDSSRDVNTKLEEEAQKNNVRVLYKNDVYELLSRAAKIQMANNLLNI